MSIIHRGARLFTASVVATLVDAAVLLGLAHHGGVAARPAAIAGCLAGGAVNFALSRGWVFGARRRALLPQALRYAVLVVVGGALWSGLAIGLVADAGAPLLVAKAIAVPLVMIGWTYPVSARLVFGGRRGAAAGGYSASAAPGSQASTSLCGSHAASSATGAAGARAVRITCA
jgi:putative flippase GtrA